MVDVLGALLRATSALVDIARRLREKTGFLDATNNVDPEVEARVRRLFAELRNRPLVQPSRDLAQEVADRLRRSGMERAPPANDEAMPGDGP
jgi:hypothetical protein